MTTSVEAKNNKLVDMAFHEVLLVCYVGTIQGWLGQPNGTNSAVQVSLLHALVPQVLASMLLDMVLSVVSVRSLSCVGVISYFNQILLAKSSICRSSQNYFVFVAYITVGLQVELWDYSYWLSSRVV